MNAFESQRQELAAFPPALRALIDAELARGNEITGVGHWYPAPPSGAFVTFARPVTSHPHRDSQPAPDRPGLRFRERHSTLYSGEFTDAQEQYFVLTAPLNPPPAPRPDRLPYTVEVDTRGGILTYREAHRSTDVSCTFDGDPRIAPRTLSGWWYPAESRAEKMTPEEQATTLERIADYCRRFHGMPRMTLESDPSRR